MLSDERQYLNLLTNVMTHGDVRTGRNGVTRSLFGPQMTFDLSKGLPVLTTKKIHFHSVVTELLWMLRGDTNVQYLHDHGVTIWDEWSDEDGNLGPVYGQQWRSWDSGSWGENIDQIQNVIDGLKSDPYGRRHVVSAWNPADIEDMALPPCHCLFQFHVTTSGKLNCKLYQRSADIFLGVPFNIASYALLTHIIAREVGLEPGKFIHSFGDVHLYGNHLNQAAEQLNRAHKVRPSPTLSISRDAGGIFDLKPSDFSLIGYDPMPAIKAPVSA